MNAREILAKLAGPSLPIGHLPGGKPSLTAVDIAACMTQLRDGPTALMRVKYALDRSSVPALQQACTRTAFRMAEQQNWRRDERFADQVKTLASLAWEHTVHPNVCRSCKGRGERSNRKGVVVVCRSCFGTGKGETTDASRAKTMQLARSSYSRTWAPRFAHLVVILQFWEQNAARSMGKQLNGDDD